MKPLSLLLLCGLTAFAQYTSASAGAPPAALKPEIAAALAKAGVKVVAADGKVWCEVWMAAKAPQGSNAEENATMTTVPQGALLGAIHFPANGADRRGQTIKAGVYTLRYSVFPINGDHQGVAPQRDFAILTPAAEDADPAATPNFETLMNWSRKASGTPHPAVLSMWKQEPGDFKEGVSQMGEHDTVLQLKVGDIPVAIILVGKAEG
jgi:hypothetical protein